MGVIPETSPAPKKLSFSDIEKMKRGRKAFELFKVPFMDSAEIAIRLLSHAEYMQCEDNGKTMAKSVLKDPEQGQIEYYTTYHLLFECCYVPPEAGEDILSAKKFFDSPAQVSRLSLDELTTLINYYTDVRDKYGVFDQFTNPEDFAMLIDEVKKNSVIGMSLSTITLRKLLLFSVQNNSQTSQKDNGHISTPLNLADLNKNENTTKPNGQQPHLEVKESKLEDKK